MKCPYVEKKIQMLLIQDRQKRIMPLEEDVSVKYVRRDLPRTKGRIHSTYCYKKR